MSATAILRPSATALQGGQSKARLIISAAMSKDTMSLSEITDEPGATVPPHMHELEDETFHILEGEYEFYANGEWHRAFPGETVWAPRHESHGYRALTGGRLLVWPTPSALEKMFAEFDKMPADAPPQTRRHRCVRTSPRSTRSASRSCGLRQELPRSNPCTPPLATNSDALIPSILPCAKKTCQM